MPGYTAFQWLEIAQHELLLFAGIFFLIGSLDELVIDFAWLWLRLTGRATADRFNGDAAEPLAGRTAVLIPAWREADVVGAMIAHCLEAWRQDEVRLYAGCYRNDPETLAALVGGAGGDPRVRIVVHDADGPTTKADCLNRLYAALVDDERRQGLRARSVLLHDAEDLVHPAELTLIDRALDQADFVQLPVMPVPQRHSRFVAGHYGDEFAEAHGKALVVRDRLGAGLPAAGVGCGFARDALERIATVRGQGGDPFAAECLTEDYELGLLIGESGGRSRFLRIRDASGELVATREFFPAKLDYAVRQKTRWMHGIAFQGWDRLGWNARPVELWMRLRDRRGPLTALVLAAAYALVVMWGLLLLAEALGWHHARPFGRAIRTILWINFAAVLWRGAFRFAFTTRAYGPVEGMLALLRIPVANVIAIIAGRRATVAYLRTLAGGQPTWEKTIHHHHPATLRAAEA
ncbi:MAG: glycosyl transferase family protein [Novosphingobium sp.]